MKDEKEIITTVLISIEKINWKEYFKKGIWISEDSNINDISNDLVNWFIRKHERTIKNLENYEQEINNLTKKGETQWIDISNEYISITEKYMQLLKDFYIDYWHIKNSKEAQERVKLYIKTLKETNKNPSQIWQKYINEYNKVKN